MLKSTKSIGDYDFSATFQKLFIPLLRFSNILFVRFRESIKNYFNLCLEDCGMTTKIDYIALVYAY